MYVLGYTLNQMTLLALSLAIGLLIDDAVVVREAITHRLEQGEDPVHARRPTAPRTSAWRCSPPRSRWWRCSSRWRSCPASSGQFFKQFGITISVAVLISLFISFTLDPMLSARLAKARKPGEAHQENAVAAHPARAASRAPSASTSGILRWVLGHKWTTAGITAAGAGGLVRRAPAAWARSSSPAEDRSQFMVRPAAAGRGQPGGDGGAHRRGRGAAQARSPR